MRPSRSTSAISPSRAAPSSRAQIVRIVSAAVSASICTARPPSKRTLQLAHDGAVRSTSGLVELTVPSTRAGSGEVKTSSVGMFGMCTSPSARSKRAAAQRALGSRPTVRSVPGPS